MLSELFFINKSIKQTFIIIQIMLDKWQKSKRIERYDTVYN